MKSKLRIGSRGSRLAVLQAKSVRDQLRAMYPGTEIEMITVTTTGDQNTTISLEQMGGEGVFVKELEEALLNQDIDLAVHSLKDMLTTLPKELVIAAVPERVDPRDVIISPGVKLADLPSGARIGTGSQRRAVQIRALRPDLEICGIRGNIDTRIRKAFTHELDAIVMAAAALVRLELEDRVSEYLSVENCIPAVGQGALGIEIRASDSETYEMVNCLNHWMTLQTVSAERAFLRALGGGCRAPIAAVGAVDGDKLTLNGIVADPEGKTILKQNVHGNVSNPEEIGQKLAEKMIGLGAGVLLNKA